jgi:DNA-binding response OmpR family regulator
VAKILVVDDDRHMRELLREELEDEGYEVVLACDGDEAVASVRADPPDLVILDLAMPRMHGTEALPQILDARERIPVIINTAYGSYRDDFITWAATAYVVKGGDTTELKDQVEAALRKRDVSTPTPPGAEPGAQA